METQYFKIRRSRTVINGDTNGGPKGSHLIADGLKHDVFPRLRKDQLTTGVDMLRKLFVCYEDPNNEYLTDFETYMKIPSTGDSAILIGKSDHDETQADVNSDPPIWLGSGQLNTDPTGNTEVELIMESTEAGFIPGGYLYLCDSFMTVQTIDDGTIPGRPAVKEGDSCEYISGSWRKANHDDYVYPNGYYTGSQTVMTIDGSTQELFILLAENKTTDEVIGTGDATTQPALTDLTNVTNGLVTRQPYKAVVTSVDGDTNTQTCYINEDGSVTGDCSAGEINVNTGVWVTDIAWTAAPVGNITITYYDKNYTYSGSVCTVELDSAVSESFSTANTYGAGICRIDEIKTSWEDETVTSTSGTFDSSSGNLILNPAGAEDDIITLTFTSATNFTATGAYFGSIGTGDILTDFEPINTATGYTYFTLKSASWGGTFAIGETVSFHIRPQAQGFWFRKIVEAGASETANDFTYPEFWAV